LKRLEKVNSDVNSVKLNAGVIASVPLSFFSVGGKGMVSIGFLSLPSVGVGMKAVRLVEPVVEEAKVNKQKLAANQLMIDRCPLQRYEGCCVAGWTRGYCSFGRL
jgi:hypothetical protein